MVNRRLILPATTLIALAGSFFIIIWGIDNSLKEKQRESVLSSALAEFQFDHPVRRRRFDSKNRDGIFSVDLLCGGCYHAVAQPEENVRCGLLIHNLMKELGISKVDAAIRISSDDKFQDQCTLCRPDACSQEEKIYWRYDSAPLTPRVLSSNVPDLRSIPATNRIPSYAVTNLTDFFSQPNNAAPSATYLFDYNPSIVIFPNKLETPQYQDRPAYVASFRVSTQQSCFHPYEAKAMYGGSWDKKPPMQNYLGLALLRPDLSIMEDVVVDVKASGIFQTFAEDFRLFVLDKQLYVASFDLIAPLWITREGDSSMGSPKKECTVLKNVFPSKLKVCIRPFPSCPVCCNRPNKRCGKNLNYFSSTTMDHDDMPRDSTGVYVEVWPSGPHVVQQMNLHESCSDSRKREETANEKPLTFSDQEKQILPTWYTMEEVMFPTMKPSETILARGRGGACCITIQDPRTGDVLFAGIYHTKIPKFGKRSGKHLPVWVRTDVNSTEQQVLPNQYLSIWYAFRSTPPFKVVAQSGHFCLGYPSVNQEKVPPVVKATLWKKFVFGGNGANDDTKDSNSLVLECPRIHFVSGISEKANDPSKVIVAYGINDCVSRFIEIQKTAIVQALFPRALSRQ